MSQKLQPGSGVPPQVRAAYSWLPTIIMEAVSLCRDDLIKVEQLG
jgi:hypothetical protein